MKILYTRPDGGVSVVHAAEQSDVAKYAPEVSEMTEGRFIAWIKDKDVPADAADVRIIEDADIPSDRHFRNAWAYDGTIKVDMPKAREIHKNNLRRERTPLLAALDVEYQRADESGDTAKKRAIAAEKQALRDITQHPGIAAAATPEELKTAALPALAAAGA